MFAWLVLAAVTASVPGHAGANEAVAKPVKFGVAHADVMIETAHSGPVGLRVSYPTGGSDAYPLVVFSHGHYLTNGAYDNLTDKWVEQGYFVIAPQHMDTGDRQYVQALSEKVGRDWISVARVLDMKAALDQVDTIANSIELFRGSVSSDHVIVAGHSFGALSAQLMAGAFFERQDDSAYPIPDTLNDQRVAAVVAISPPGLMPGFVTQKTWRGFSAPQLVVTGTMDVFDHIWQDHREHFVSYETANPGHNYLLVIDGMDHYMGRLIGRLERPQAPQVQALGHVAEQSLRFMKRYLQLASGVQGGAIEDQRLKVSPRPGIVRYERR